MISFTFAAAKKARERPRRFLRQHKDKEPRRGCFAFAEANDGVIIV